MSEGLRSEPLPSGEANRAQQHLLEELLIPAAVAAAMGMKATDVADVMLSAYLGVLASSMRGAGDEQVRRLAGELGAGLFPAVRAKENDARDLFETILRSAVKRRLAQVFPAGRA